MVLGRQHEADGSNSTETKGAQQKLYPSLPRPASGCISRICAAEQACEAASGVFDLAEDGFDDLLAQAVPLIEGGSAGAAPYAGCGGPWRNGAPWPTKMGTTRSPFPYDAVACQTLQCAKPRLPTISCSTLAPVRSCFDSCGFASDANRESSVVRGYSAIASPARRLRFVSRPRSRSPGGPAEHRGRSLARRSSCLVEKGWQVAAGGASRSAPIP
jgi:hypothetical protein